MNSTKLGIDVTKELWNNERHVGHELIDNFWNNPDHVKRLLENAKIFVWVKVYETSKNVDLSQLKDPRDYKIGWVLATILLYDFYKLNQQILKDVWWIKYFCNINTLVAQIILKAVFEQMWYIVKISDNQENLYNDYKNIVLDNLDHLLWVTFDTVNKKIDISRLQHPKNQKVGWILLNFLLYNIYFSNPNQFNHITCIKKVDSIDISVAKQLLSTIFEKEWFVVQTGKQLLLRYIDLKKRLLNILKAKKWLIENKDFNLCKFKTMSPELRSILYSIYLSKFEIFQNILWISCKQDINLENSKQMLKIIFEEDWFNDNTMETQQKIYEKYKMYLLQNIDCIKWIIIDTNSKVLDLTNLTNIQNWLIWWKSVTLLLFKIYNEVPYKFKDIEWLKRSNYIYSNIAKSLLKTIFEEEWYTVIAEISIQKKEFIKYNDYTQYLLENLNELEWAIVDKENKKIDIRKIKWPQRYNIAWKKANIFLYQMYKLNIYFFKKVKCVVKANNINAEKAKLILKAVFEWEWYEVVL